VHVVVDRTQTLTDSSWLDIFFQGKTVCVECCSDGFGLYYEGNICYGEGPDEIFDEDGMDLLVNKIVELLGD